MTYVTYTERELSAKMKMNEPVTRKLESHSFWQQANRIKIYSTLLKAEQREPFIFLDSQQRAKGDLISGVARDFCPSVSFQCSSLAVSPRPRVQSHALTSVHTLKNLQFMQEFGGLCKH